MVWLRIPLIDGIGSQSTSGVSDHNINPNSQDGGFTMDKANPQPQDKHDKKDDKTSVEPPFIVVDLGSRRKKLIQDLRKGRGKLLHEVELAVEQARAAVPESDKNKTVVILYQQKRRRKRRVDDFLPFNPLNPFSIFRC